MSTSVVQISKMVIKSGLSTDLPNALSEGELGYATDTGEVFIGSPNLTKIAYREKSSTSDGVFPYQNVKLMTEFDFPRVITGDYYIQGPLLSVTIPSGGESTLMYSADSGINVMFLNWSAKDASSNMLGIGQIQASSAGFVTMGNDISGITFSNTWTSSTLSIYCVNTSSSNITFEMCATNWTM